MSLRKSIIQLKKNVARKTFKLRHGYSTSDERHRQAMELKKSSSNVSDALEVQQSGVDCTRVEESRRRGVKRCQNKFNVVFDNTSNIKKGDKLLLTMGKNDNSRIPYFIEYYEGLGVDHFIIIDNNSDQPMSSVVPNKKNVSLWHTDDCYVESKFGVDWMNYFNGKYSVGHWVLTVDLDEFFVFPEMERRSFGELLLFLDTIEQRNMFAPLVDVYPNGPISEAVVPLGKSPLDFAHFFDASGFYAIKGGYGDLWLRGGPRCRVFNHGDIEKSPTLNKTPLVKWQEETLYLASTHTLYPSTFNDIYPSGIHSPTCALLHTKFISEAKEKAKYAVVNKNHYDGSREYKEYLKKLEENENLNLYDYCSREFISSESLVEAGIMTKGVWGI